MCYLADLLLLRILHVSFLSYPFVIKFPSQKSLASSACNMLNESSDNANFYCAFNPNSNHFSSKEY